MQQWERIKSNGSVHYMEGRFREALSAFNSSLVSAPQSEKKILHANISACHLKLKDGANALVSSLACTGLDPKWAKGQIRLAESYILLGKSNDACVALQKALAIDPRNEGARRMLTTEMRKRDVQHGQQNPPNTNNSNSNSNNHQQQHQQRQRQQQQPGFVAVTFDRVNTWWRSLPSETRGLITISGAFLCLVLFLHTYLGGGGVGGGGASKNDNYDSYDSYDSSSGSAYDEYRRKHNKPSPRTRKESRSGTVNTRYYDLLNCDSEAPMAEIKTNYRKLAKVWHPDRNQGDKNAAAKFRAIEEAYNTLSDDRLRAKYDRGGENTAYESTYDYEGRREWRNTRSSRSSPGGGGGGGFGGFGNWSLFDGSMTSWIGE
mgnify:CR=1 FL=1